MKTALLAAAVLVVTGLSLAWAGHFTDILPPASAAGCVPVSNGYDYNCSNDTSAPAVQLKAVLSLLPQTTTQIQALVPGTTDQVVACSNCTRSYLCVSSGTAAGAWTVAVETGTMASPTHCQ